ncbi:carbohydrate ABC transporter substrate-binding protein [Endozoicomonas sp. SM1973]|uniref:Probable sugar-binding periplasmic protein n=1 Tax=Spartinivicinus marinus TaxID=2994442 RepID=A0A853I755_9GAMM|nr:ABC transporter substrate-binding protein [Spartinivicinus marinus]MCX4029808.1 ABC transporter substrate-binding protein [Spartinivicinus marinus]NYZ67522.1 carbohydrate ABC transporter substrate-binding protein [Spartinivicinus marinus]
MLKHYKKAVIGLFMMVFSHATIAGEVEVLHWWTSAGEVRALNALKLLLIEQGHSWKDFSVEGGGGDKAMAVLRSRLLSGAPPTAAHGKGGHMQEWGKLGLLANLGQIADEQNWPEILPTFVNELMKYNGQYVAVPVNIHRINWLWVNAALLQQANVAAPTTIEAFWQVADKLKKAGIIPLAHGDQPWQNSILFEMLLLGITDSHFFKKAFIDFEEESLSSKKIIKVFAALRKLKQYMDPNIANRDWDKATDMVIQGKAAMQIMGDWAKGEFTAVNKQLGRDILCLPVPSTDKLYSYVVDSFIMFNIVDQENKKAQIALAKQMLNKNFQQVFNINKGSIPARQDMSMNAFDICAKTSKEAVQTVGNENVLPNISIGMATSIYTQAAISEVVTHFFRNDKVTPEQAAEQLANAIKVSL